MKPRKEEYTPVRQILTIGSTTMLYYLIWLLLQIFVTVYQYLRELYQRLRKANRSYDLRGNGENCTEFTSDAENAFLAQCRKQLDKIPRHLSFIIGPDERVGEKILKRILGYALRMKIDCISFYDTRPEKSRIQLNTLQPPKGIISKPLGERHMLWIASSPSNGVNGKASDPNCNGIKNANGYSKTNGHVNSAEQSIEIYEIDNSDGRALISDVCRELFLLRRSHEVQELLQNRSLLMQRVNESMSQRLWKCTDPEVCIVFSKQMCTFGFLCWHTRFTEFYIHQQEDLFDTKAFAKILFRYSRCEQRWGK